MSKGKPPILQGLSKFIAPIIVICLIIAGSWLCWASFEYVAHGEILVKATKFSGNIKAYEGERLVYRTVGVERIIGRWQKTLNCDLLVDTVFNDGETALVKFNMNLPIDIETAIMLSKKYESRTDFYVNFLQNEMTRAVHKVSVTMSARESFSHRRRELFDRTRCLFNKSLGKENLRMITLMLDSIKYDNIMDIIGEINKDC